MYLVFDSHDEAYIANAVISLNMRLSGNLTVQWAEILEREDGKFLIPKPDECVMGCVSGYAEETEEVEGL